MTVYVLNEIDYSSKIVISLKGFLKREDAVSYLDEYSKKVLLDFKGVGGYSYNLKPIRAFGSYSEVGIIREDGVVIMDFVIDFVEVDL